MQSKRRRFSGASTCIQSKRRRAVDCAHRRSTRHGRLMSSLNSRSAMQTMRDRQPVCTAYMAWTLALRTPTAMHGVNVTLPRRWLTDKEQSSNAAWVGKRGYTRMADRVASLLGWDNRIWGRRFGAALSNGVS